MTDPVPGPDEGTLDCPTCGEETQKPIVVKHLRRIQKWAACGHWMTIYYNEVGAYAGVEAVDDD